jgi:2-polyprenyl-6-methoxyphenol hydroxylase-like FAD-dependent oxidoreductase
MDVAIVGGGICGLSLALNLKERGIACRVYERAPESKSSGLASRCFRMPCGSSVGELQAGRRLRLGRCCGLTHSALGDPIADSGLGEHYFRIVRMLFNFLSKLADVNAQILRIFGMRGAPYRG